MSRPHRKYRKPGLFTFVAGMHPSDAEMVRGIVARISSDPAGKALADLAVGQLMTVYDPHGKADPTFENALSATQRNLVTLCKLAAEHKETALMSFLGAIYPALLFFARGYGQDFDLWDLADHHGLTRREKDTLALAGSGLSNKEIASQFDISLSAVKQTLKRVFKKTGSHSLIEAIGALRPAVLDQNAPLRTEATGHRCFSLALKDMRRLTETIKVTKVIYDKKYASGQLGTGALRCLSKSNETAAIKRTGRSKGKKPGSNAASRQIPTAQKRLRRSLLRRHANVLERTRPALAAQ